MTVQKIVFILAHLILSNLAAPFQDGHHRRSLVSGLGDIGGQLRDESDNFESTAYGDSMLGGQYNKFVPMSTVNGIEGLAPLRALKRRTQVVGNSGNTRINRDESYDFVSETLGDSLNQGVGNAVSPKSVVGGITSGATGGLLGRRSQVIQKDGDTKLNRDESGNFYADTYGDSANQGIGSVISPDSVVGGAARGLLGRRSQVIQKDGDTKLNRDESGNFYADTYGDSANQGIGSVISPDSVVGGAARGLLGRRSQVVEKSGNTQLNRDESGNFYAQTLLDSLNQGIGNRVSPQSTVGGPSRSLLRRSQVIENDANVMINSDQSANVYEETLQDSTNQGVGNTINPMSIITGPSGGLGLLGRRSQHVKFTGDMTLNDDSSVNVAEQSAGNTVNSASTNQVSPAVSVAPTRNPIFRRRSPQGPAEAIIKSVMSPDNPNRPGVVLGSQGESVLSRRGDDQYLLTGTRYVRIDDSRNSYQVTSGDSVNQGMGNILQPLTQIGAPNARLVRRTQTIANRGSVMVNTDQSTNGYTETYGDSANQGFLNSISPMSLIAGPAVAPRQRRDKILNNMNEVVEWDRSTNNYGVTYGDSVNAGTGNVINPQTLIAGIAGSALVGPRVAPPAGPLSAPVPAEVPATPASPLARPLI